MKHIRLFYGFARGVMPCIIWVWSWAIFFTILYRVWVARDHGSTVKADPIEHWIAIGITAVLFNTIKAPEVKK